MERQSYPTDLTDEQWAQTEPLFVGMREYKRCKWRQLPHDFPPPFTLSSSAVSTEKKTKGRKRHIVTDIATETYPTIKRFCADRGYRDTFIQDAYALLHRDVDISESIKSGKRWVVERTFAPINNSVV